MIKSHIGEFAALLTAFFWAITAINFEAASKRVGSLPVNFLRLLIAFFLLGVYLTITNGVFIPFAAPKTVWFWLSLSGIVGFVIGDYCLFQSYVEIGARIAMLIMALVPIITAIIGWLFLDEILMPLQVVAMVLTIGGIVSVIFERNKENNSITLTHSLKGILLAFGGAIGQAVGLILSKYGMKNYNPFMATQIGVINGTIGFGIILILTGKVKLLRQALRDRKALQKIGIGAFFGPFLGVTFSLYAVQHTAAGVASTIMAIVPVIIIPFSLIFLKDKVRFKEVLGALITVIGVVIFFL